MAKRLPNLPPDRSSSWLGERLDLEPLMELMAHKMVPVHRHSWIYLLGGAALFCFLLQVATGSLLMLYYQPTEAAAHASVARIANEVPYGWFVRSMHAWGANFFIGLVLLHFLTVLFTRAYRKPRELTWLSGMSMLFLSLGIGFSGYLLPWNELSYYATLVGTQIPGTLPVVGDFVVHLLRGGAQVTGDTITRFSAAHVVILPLLLGGGMLVHLALVQFQGMSRPLGMGVEEIEEERPFFSEFAIIDACLWCLILGVLATLALLLPAEIGVEADPLKPAPSGIEPEWYFLFMFKTLKHVPETVGVLFFSLMALFLFFLPFFDRRAGRGEKSPIFTGIFLCGLGYAVVFELLALIGPGMEHPPEALTAPTYDLAHGLVTLVLVWGIIGFLVFYLWKMMRENARVRKLYEGG